MGQVEANLDFCAEIRGTTEYLLLRRSKGTPAEHIGVTVASWPVASVTDPMVAGAAADRKHAVILTLGQASAGITSPFRAAVADLPVIEHGPFAGASPAAFAAALTEDEIKALGEAVVLQALPSYLRLSAAACCSAP